MDRQSPEKLVKIEALPEPERKTKPAGRKPKSHEEKIADRAKKGLGPMKDIVQVTPARKKAIEKARLVGRLKREYQKTQDESRKYELQVQINALTPNKVEPIANKDLKEKIKRQNPAYKEEGLEDYSLDHNADLRSTGQDRRANLLQWSNSSQELWNNKLSALETKMNSLDEYLAKIRILSGEGSSGDYANPNSVKHDQYIPKHNPSMNPQHGPKDNNPFNARASKRMKLLSKK